MRRALVAGVAAAAACGGPRAPANAPEEGLAISVYATPDRTQAVIDDRRTIDVARDGSTIWLDRIDPAAALSTLVIEPLDGRPLAIEPCARPRLAARVMSPLVACTVRGRPGRRLVRVHHATVFPPLRAQHEIAMTAADRAAIATRYTLVTPAWGVRGELALFDGAPGGGDAPRLLARGRAVLDGSTAIFAAPPRTVPARVVRVFAGGEAQRGEIRVMLELDDPALFPAPAYVRAEGREIATAYVAEPDRSGPARLALWRERRP